jgi:hypothetical protein
MKWYLAKISKYAENKCFIWPGESYELKQNGGESFLEWTVYVDHGVLN